MAILVKKVVIGESLEAEPVQGKRLLEPLKTVAKEARLPLNILEDTNVVNEPEMHTHEGDLWQCLEGEVTFVCGGKLVNPRAKVGADGVRDEREWKGDSIKGGETFRLRSGDWLWIPPGEPHQHGVKEGTARLLIVKIPSSTEK